MKTEYECRILDIDVDKLQKKLLELGAEKIKERKMRRYVYDIAKSKVKSWIRLRDDGQKTTLTVKEIHSDEVDGTKEEEVIVNDFEKTNSLLNKLGFDYKAYQENRRISFKLNNTFIDIDFWPKIPPHLEIEGNSKEEVENVVKILGFTMEDTTSIGIEKVYQKYGINIHEFKELHF